MALLGSLAQLSHVFGLLFSEQGGSKSRLKPTLNRPAEHPLYMKQLQKRHFSLFGVLRDHCLFLTRRQIERILTLPRSSTTRELLWLVSRAHLYRTYFAAPLPPLLPPLH